MTIPADAFVHHPELRDRIADPDSSTFRNFNLRKRFAEEPEMHWALDYLHTDAEREANRRELLAGHEGDLWVFAYGSLMWDPAFHFLEVRRAHLTGYSRRFILKDIFGARGTRERPGLMAALDAGDACSGLAFRIAADIVERETEILWSREKIGPAYQPRLVTVETDHGAIRALAFIANHEAASVCPELTVDEQSHYIATGVGFRGSSREYLVNIIEHFALLGIEDQECRALLNAVDARIAGAVAR